MATRRVKRIKHTKKHLQHGRRKTKHRRRQRHTRRQQGGMFALKGFAKMFTKKINPRGGSLYDGIEVFSADDDTFNIGNQRLDEYDASRELENKIYADKIRFYLTSAKIKFNHNDMIVLTTQEFDKFVGAFVYGPKYDPTPFLQKSAAVVPRAAVASAAASGDASASDADSKKILIKRDGVQFKGDLNTWKGNVCEFPKIAEEPFKKFVFTMKTNPPSVLVKYVMSSDAKTFCALAKYQTKDSMYECNIDFSLFSPSVTLTLNAKNEDPWNITSAFDYVYGKIKRCYDSCEEPYNDSYAFYQENHTLIAMLFFTEPPETVYPPIVYQRVIQKRIVQCMAQIRLNKLFREDEATPIITHLEDFEQRLKELSDDPNPNLKALKTLDNEVNTYVRVTFQRLLVQKNKESLVDRMSSLSIGAAAAAP
jgi:hypothetical protein